MYNVDMLTTTIGSYPYDYKKLGTDAIRRAVQEQVDAGVDIVSDGQTRCNMIEYFAKNIEGYKWDGKSIVDGKIGRGKPEMFITDLALAQELAPRVKGIVTGPVTLVFASRINGSVYNGYRDRSLYLDTANAILDIALAMERQGAEWIQIDEPSLSTGAPMDIAQEAIEIIATALTVPVALHICGDVKTIIERLLTLQGVITLSHGFKGEDNMPILKNEKVIRSDKCIGLGCVDTKTNRVEDVEEIAGVIKAALRTINKERLIIHPDCGLRILERNTAYEKLKNMVVAARMFD